MGEMTEMVLDGLLCQVCGGVIDGGESGYPRYCSDECEAAHDEGEED